MKHLRLSILIGLIFYNVYNITDLILMPDIAWFGIALRVLIVSPFSIGLAWAVGRVTPRIREGIVCVGMVNAVAIPMLLFSQSSSPTAILTFIEIPLTLVFGSTMLLLRFPWALALTATSFVMVGLGVAFAPQIDGALAFVLVIQMATACFFTLYGNYKLESARRGAYLVTLREILRSDRLSIDRDVLTAMSTTDALTGLSNRRKLDETLAAWEEEASLLGTVLSVLMIDVDHFKRFNDAYGHPEGDACLRRVADTLADEARSAQNLVARYGGEEFSILMRASDAAGIERTAQRLCARIAGLGIPHATRGDGLEVVTISVGVAVRVAKSSPSRGQLVTEADAALYDAKRGGRNRAVIRWTGKGVAGTAPSVQAAEAMVP